MASTNCSRDLSFKDYSSNVDPSVGLDEETGLRVTPEPPESPIPNGPIPNGLIRQTIRHFVDSRRIAVKKDPQLIKTYRWDQSDIFYNTRKMLDAKGYEVSIFSNGSKRENTIAYIAKYCDKLGIKRHEIGIFPADRAVMVYQGKTYSVGYENYQELAEKGVDIVCVEKEGIVEKLLRLLKV